MAAKKSTPKPAAAKTPAKMPATAKPKFGSPAWNQKYNIKPGKK